MFFVINFNMKIVAIGKIYYDDLAVDPGDHGLFHHQNINYF